MCDQAHEHLVTRPQQSGHGAATPGAHGRPVSLSLSAPPPPVREATVGTHCPYCALQCAMTLTPVGSGAVVEAGSGGLCRKGWTSAALLDSPERLTTPLVRDGRHGRLRAAAWDEALDRAAAGFAAARAAHGPDAVGVFGGGGLTNEKAYLLGKLARVVLGTSQIDYNGRFCMSSAAAGAVRAFGLDRGLPFPLSDLGEADCTVLVGSNLAETMPPVVQHLARARAAGASLVVVDPRRTPTAAAATLHLQPQPGTDLALANGLLFLAVEEGAVDRAYVGSRTTGWEAVRRTVSAYWPARVERLTGVPEPDLRAAVRLLAEARRALVVTGRAAGARRARRRHLAAAADHRAGRRAVPVGRADPPDRGA